jgi:Xaa-Pro aminopeptidase
MTTIVQEKTEQAIGILRQQDIDCWLTFVRETMANKDSALDLIYGSDLTWHSALLLTKGGERIAIVGRFEAEAARRTGAYGKVVPYDQAIRTALTDELKRLDPKRIAINYSLNDVHADGLTYGMYQLLLKFLEGTPYASRLVSAETLQSALRGRKTATEIERIRTAIQTTNHIFDRTFAFITTGMSEIQVGEFMHRQLDECGVSSAWEYHGCPIVNAGPDSVVGHVGPTSKSIAPGHILHIDFGVKQDGYCSDLQRVVYFQRPGESSPPPEVQRAFETVRQAIENARQAMKPGMRGKDVDQVARQTIVNAGYPEFMYATGHQLGRVAHDGAGILGPEWERYGDTPNYLLEAGQVYTLEPGIEVPGYGYLGLEEDVVVTDDSTMYLGEPQRKLVIK